MSKFSETYCNAFIYSINTPKASIAYALIREIFKLGINTIGLNLDFLKQDNVLFKEIESSAGLELDEYATNKDEAKLEEELKYAVN